MPPNCEQTNSRLFFIRVVSDYWRGDATCHSALSDYVNEFVRRPYAYCLGSFRPYALTDEKSEKLGPDKEMRVFVRNQHLQHLTRRVDAMHYK